MASILVILGSPTDSDYVQPLKEILDEFGVSFELHYSSAHRKPEQTRQLAKDAASRGIKVIIAAAGMAAHLPGVVASYTHLPVIGVPLAGSSLLGMDALLAIVQMPGGVPVASMAIGKPGMKNAALFAIQILALSQPELETRYLNYKQRLAE